MYAVFSGLAVNAIARQNEAALQMVQNSDRMSAIAFGNSQPLKPSFAAQADKLELQNKKNETKMTVFQALSKAINAGNNAAKIITKPKSIMLPNEPLLSNTSVHPREKNTRYEIRKVITTGLIHFLYRLFFRLVWPSE